VDKKIPDRKPAKIAVKAIQRQYTMLPADADLIDEIRDRYQGEARKRRRGPVDIAKSEVIRAGILLLDTLRDKQLYTAIERVETLHEGRPKKESA
jgi:hypothetical protein